jgi:hypothetical protein
MRDSAAAAADTAAAVWEAIMVKVGERQVAVGPLTQTALT